MRNTLNEEKLKDKFESGDKEKIESAVQETLDWLDKNQLAEKDEFEAKQKELEGVVNPIMMKVYQAAGGGGMPEGGMPGGGMGGAPGGGAGPTVEEVDSEGLRPSAYGPESLSLCHGDVYSSGHQCLFRLFRVILEFDHFGAQPIQT